MESSSIKLGHKFITKDGNIGIVTEVFSKGLNYHTYDEDGDCIIPQRYIKKDQLDNVRR